MIEIIVGKNENGQRLDRVLEKILKNSNMSFIFKMLRKKNITLDDRKASGNERLAYGSSIKLWFSDESFEKLTGKKDDKANMAKQYAGEKTDIYVDNKKPGIKNSYFDFESRIIYEDENTLIVNKPAGILSQKSHPEDVSLNEYLLDYLRFDESMLNTFKPSVCNRLDRNTSGLVICGKSLEGLRINNELIKTKKINKYYLALVCGVVTGTGKAAGWLRKDEKSNRVTVKEEPFEAASFIQTEYTPLKICDGSTLLLVKLITGRTHQIRAHLSFMGHPIVGDYKYGRKNVNAGFRKKYGIKSQLLHSYKLDYPKTANTAVNDTDTFRSLAGRTFVAEPGDDFRKVAGDGYLEDQRA